MSHLLLVFAGIFSTVACSKYKAEPPREIFISGSNKLEQSSTAGNLMATAIREAYQLDIVFYPSRFVSKESGATLSPRASGFENDRLLNFYPAGPKDLFISGTMSGKDIRKFVYSRSTESYEMDLEVAGIEYDIGFIGGYPQYAYINRELGQPLEDDKRYRVAISEYYYFAGDVFPAYKYRNGISSKFSESKRGLSAREALLTYLKRHEQYTGIEQVRARVTTTTIGSVGEVNIRDIQGSAHRSPYFGHEATTRGIVTAVGSVSWYPNGTDLYIQNPDDDGDPRTSEGLYVYLTDKNSQLIRLGDEVQVTGVIYERLAGQGLGKTGLLEVSQLKVLSQGQKLPEPVKLGIGGRALPHDAISTFKGDLNFKPDLNLEDGIDFWESLEGMRVEINNPRVVSFRGGQEAFVDRGPKNYLTLYLVPDGDTDNVRRTPTGGLIIDSKNNLFNPQILQLITNHLSSPIDTKTLFRVGDQMTGPIAGVLGYEFNIFGDAEYSLVLPQEQLTLSNFVKKEGLNPERSSDGTADLNVRPKTRLVSDDTSLTAATFNVKNLSGNTPNRVAKVAEAIGLNLHCPDILTVPEVQDENGPDFSEGSSAEETLKSIVRNVKCPFKYEFLNIDPVPNDEGGQPGGNIRVAILYNPTKLKFESRPPPTPLSEAVVGSDGNLNFNPGRVSPNDPIFSHTRRSIVVQFEFRDRKIFVIGNHFNSKLGDSSVWSAIQPPIFDSENKRALLADKINDFVELTARRSPDSYILVMGDFNAYISENAMSVLAGANMQNLMTWDGLVAPEDRFTISYNGNGQAIDFIFASNNMMALNPQLEIVHINTPFMGQISDHDPLVAKFEFY